MQQPTGLGSEACLLHFSSGLRKVLLLLTHDLIHEYMLLNV
jgi:hypothetical protein